MRLLLAEFCTCEDLLIGVICRGKHMHNKSGYERAFTNRWLKILVKCLAVDAFVAIAWGLYIHQYFCSRIGNGASITIAYLICMIPAVKNRVWEFITDRSFSGEVISARYKESQTYDKEDPRISATKSLYTVILYIRTQKGVIIKKSIASFEPMYQDMWYHVGDQVVYHRGTKFPLIKNGRRFCAWCGDSLRPDSCFCSRCGKENY